MSRDETNAQVKLVENLIRFIYCSLLFTPKLNLLNKYIQYYFITDNGIIVHLLITNVSIPCALITANNVHQLLIC